MMKTSPENSDMSVNKSGGTHRDNFQLRMDQFAQHGVKVYIYNYALKVILYVSFLTMCRMPSNGRMKEITVLLNCKIFYTRTL